MSDSNKAVFLSYASQDAAAALRICEALRAAGVEVWFDQSELRGGDSWDAKIRKQIKECALFVPIISANTNSRPEGYFRLEWKLAVDRSHLLADDHAFLFPVVIDETAESKARVPEKFREVQWMRLNVKDTPETLAVRIGRLLGSEGMETGRPHAGERGSASAKATADEAGTGSPSKGKRPGWERYLWIGVGLVFALVYALRPAWQPPRRAEVKAVPAAPAPAAAVIPKPAESSPEPAVPSPSGEKSVAVLAFANLSDDKGNEYFSDGISEELLTVLQKIPGLHVAARTSSFYFKGKSATDQEIGVKLGVAHIVEGSVQKSGSRVKVTVHLSRAATGEEVWSESYTRELKDVFALQEELALAIVGELRGHLAGAGDAAAVKAAVQGGTNNPQAYQIYLQGRFHANRFSEKNMVEALGAYQRAVDLDPDFALAWAGLGMAHAWLCGFSSELDQAGFTAHLASARQAVQRALALAPKLPEALLSLAVIQLNTDFDLKAAGETIRTGLALAPADPALLSIAGNLANARGDMARADQYYRQAVALDPVNPLARSFLAYNLVMMGKHDEAAAEYARVVELNPAAPWAHAGLGLSFILHGKYEEGVEAAQADAAEWARLLITALGRSGQKRWPEADAALAQLTEKSGDTAAYQIAEVHAFRGERDLAFSWLERAFRQRDAGLLDLQQDPLMANLKADPRWAAFLSKTGLADHLLK